MNAEVRTLTSGESPIRGSPQFRSALLAWYDAHARSLPWRTRAGLADPYRVWLSEIMLQQTTVAAVIPYFERFTRTWPSVAALAQAPEAEVMEAWAGLGYYSRARNLIAAARIVAEQGWPQTEQDLLALPGVGPYTAAAITAIAFGTPANVVDGNVERVMARLFAVDQPLPGAKPVLKAHAAGLVGADRPGDYAQALMDLGATVCTPRSPKCGLCPVQSYCVGFAGGAPQDLPRKSPKPARPHRSGVAFVAVRDGAVWAVTRPPKGLLGGMLALPSTPWRAQVWEALDARALAPLRARWREAGAVDHVFTHFSLDLSVWAAIVSAKAAPQGSGQWIAADRLASALPTVFAKALARALEAI